MTSLEGKNFVIFAANSGLGSCLAERLSVLGARLVLTGRDGSRLERFAASLGDRHQTLTADVLSPSFEEDFVSSLCGIKSRWGIDGFDGGVYCAGVGAILPLRGLTRGAIESVFSVNYTGAVLFAKVMASKRIRHPAGASIVLIASVSSVKGQKGLGVYGASKAALANAVRSFALELAPFRVRINCVSPGWMDTRMNSEALAQVAGLSAQMQAEHPLGLGTAADAAAAVVYLLGEESRWITGSNLVVDGGFSA